MDHQTKKAAVKLRKIFEEATGARIGIPDKKTKAPIRANRNLYVTNYNL